MPETNKGTPCPNEASRAPCRRSSWPRQPSWVDKGTLLRIPVGARNRAGKPQVKAAGLVGIDDFTFTGRGDQVLAALNGPNKVVLIRPDGTSATLLDAADGLQGPTSVAVHGNDVAVLSAAYNSATDPNLLRAHLRRGHL
ncbi:hypothetical protein ACIREO_13380 [Streptomyces sp. NPDC102441]|uniref:hypothetical protein n=1 Tax=Streptomyces sp. NPDC102441 TaxID=3366176 RepID=UPI0037FF03BC